MFLIYGGSCFIVIRSVSYAFLGVRVTGNRSLLSLLNRCLFVSLHKERKMASTLKFRLLGRLDKCGRLLGVASLQKQGLRLVLGGLWMVLFVCCSYCCAFCLSVTTLGVRVPGKRSLLTLLNQCFSLPNAGM